MHDSDGIGPQQSKAERLEQRPDQSNFCFASRSRLLRVELVPVLLEAVDGRLDADLLRVAAEHVLSEWPVPVACFRNTPMSRFFSHLLPKPHTNFYVCHIDGMARIFSYLLCRNQESNSRQLFFKYGPFPASFWIYFSFFLVYC